MRQYVPTYLVLPVQYICMDRQRADTVQPSITSTGTGLEMET